MIFTEISVLHSRYGSDSFDISEIIENVFGSAKTKQEKDEVLIYQ